MRFSQRVHRAHCICTYCTFASAVQKSHRRWTISRERKNTTEVDAYLIASAHFSFPMLKGPQYGLAGSVLALCPPGHFSVRQDAAVNISNLMTDDVVPVIANVYKDVRVRDPPSLGPKPLFRFEVTDCRRPVVLLFTSAQRRIPSSRS